VKILKSLPPGSVVLLRRPRTGLPGFIEGVVEGMVGARPDISVEWFAPQPGGRDQTYRRDFDFVSSADRVEAWFDADAAMEGGTGHVVEAALARGVPVTAWSITKRGRIDRVGELENREDDV
jgi:hypothetical protein